MNVTETQSIYDTDKGTVVNVGVWMLIQQFILMRHWLVQPDCYIGWLILLAGIGLS